jgi:hypothetical protein
MKTTIFFLVTMFFGISVFNKKPTALVGGTQNQVENTNEPRIDFILGSWTGTGFITDANGLEQYVEIQENNSSVSNTQYRYSVFVKTQAAILSILMINPYFSILPQRFGTSMAK